MWWEDFVHNTFQTLLALIFRNQFNLMMIYYDVQWYKEHLCLMKISIFMATVIDLDWRDYTERRTSTNSLLPLLLLLLLVLVINPLLQLEPYTVIIKYIQCPHIKMSKLHECPSETNKFVRSIYVYGISMVYGMCHVKIQSVPHCNEGHSSNACNALAPHGMSKLHECPWEISKFTNQ